MAKTIYTGLEAYGLTGDTYDMKVGYDASNYVGIAVDSSGNWKIEPQSSASGDQAITIGSGAETNNNTNNIAIGYLADATDPGSAGQGTGGIAIGGQSIATGDQSVAIGSSAEVNKWGGIAIGWSTSVTSSFSSSFGIGIGYNADVTNFDGIAIGRNTSSTGNGSIVIGHENSSSTPLTNSTTNSLGIGWDNSTGLEFLFAGGTTDSYLTSGSNGQVGVGLTSPTSKLHVQGAGSTNSTDAFIVQNSSSSTLLHVQDDGDIGIGTSTPDRLLTIKTSTNDDGMVIHNGSNAIRGAFYYQSATDSTDVILYDGSQIRTRLRGDSSSDSYVHGTLLIDNNFAATTVQSGYQIDFRGRTKLASHTGLQNCRVIGSGGACNLDIIANVAAVTGNTRSYRFGVEGVAALGNKEARFVIRGYNDDDGSASEILPTTGRANYLYIEPRGHTNGSIFDVITVNPSKSDIDFNIMGDTDNDLFYLDASVDAIGISTNTPDTNSVLHVAGEFRLDATTATTANSGGQTLPSNPVGFVQIIVNGTNFKLPYYNT